MHDGQGGFPLIPTFLAEESFLDVFPYNAGNQLRTLQGDVVDAVFQPDNLAPWHGPGGSGDAGLPFSTHLPRNSASARKWASSAKNIVASVRWASSHRAAYSATKASRLDSFLLTRRFLGRLKANPSR